jgi:protein AATF/BFR2
VAGSKLSFPLPSDPEGEIEAKRQDTLRSLAELSDKLFALRESLPLPGVELPEGLGKRKRGDAEDDVLEEQYWMDAAGDSLEIEDA